jgi:hypothetical protein
MAAGEKMNLGMLAARRKYRDFDASRAYKRGVRRNLLQRVIPQLARPGPRAMPAFAPLLRVERTFVRQAKNDAFDPKRP